MHLPRVWFSVRRLMVAVAVAALLSGALVLHRRSTAFAVIALEHAGEIFGIEEETPPREDWESIWFADAPDRVAKPARRFIPPGRPDETPGREELEEPKIAAWRQSQRRRIAYHETMMQKYQRASRYPWLPVAPDPPVPE